MAAVKPISALFGTNATLETEGIWIDYGDYGKFLVARAGGQNKKFRNLFEKKIRPYRAAINMGTLDDAVAERIMRESFAEAVVLEWDLVDADGKSVPFTVENCIELLESNPDLFTDLQQQSQMVANFIQDTREMDAKDSGSSSSGESNTGLAPRKS